MVEKKDFYYLYEILYGLKDDYISYLDNMNELKGYFEIGFGGFKNFYLALYNHSLIKLEKEDLQQIDFIPGKIQELYVVLTDRKIKFNDYIIREFLGFQDPRYFCMKDEKGRFFTCSEHLVINNIKEFSLKMDDILNSEFVRNLNCSSVRFIDNNERVCLGLDFNCVKVKKYNDNKNREVFSLVYFPIENKLKISSDIKNKIDDEFFNNVMNYKIPKTMLNDFYRNIVDRKIEDSLSIDLDGIEVQKSKKLKLF